MTDDLAFRAEAAAEYDRAFAHVSSHFLPFVLRAARLAPGHRVLDVATGTGISAEAALDAVAPSGSVLATDISQEMVEKARKRLCQSPNAAVAVADGQALSFPEASFDAVICSLGLMFFPSQRGASPASIVCCAQADGQLSPSRSHRSVPIISGSMLS